MSGDALAYLRGRQRAGRVRFLLRRMRTARGALGTLGSAGLVVMVLGGRLVQAWAGAPAAAPATVLRYGTTGMVMLGLLGVVLTRGLAFSAAEVELLFPAPVSRRALLRHYLLSRLWVQMLAALWICLYLLPLAGLPAAGAAAVLLWFTFAFLCAVGAAQLRAWLDGVLPARPRTVAAWTVGLLAAAAAARAVYAAWRAGNPDAALDAPALRLLRGVALPFAHLFAARSAGEALAWGAASAALAAVAAACVLGVDVDLRERSLAATARVLRARNRLRGVRDADAEAAPMVRERPAAAVRVPALGWLGPAAPLARRQLTEMLRDRRRMAGALVFSLLLNGLLLATPALASGLLERAEHVGLSVVLLGLVLLVPVLTTASVSMDFRRDLDRMVLLRSLPLSPVTVAVGQIFAPVLVVAATQAVAAVAVALATGTVPALYTAAALLALPPLVWTVAAVENLVFLLLPARPIVPGTPRAVFPARNYLLALLKLLALGLALSFAVACGYLFWIVTPGWMAAAAIGATAALVLSAAGATWAAAWAFARFDVARDIPA